MNKGRPLGAKNRVITHQIGDWSWDTNKLHEKIKPIENSTCWAWTGSKGPQGNLFGAYKNKKNQMTQANRLLLMEKTGQSCERIAIRMRCANKYCCNPSHFAITPNYKHNNPLSTNDMYRLTISEQRFQDQSTLTKEKIKEMAREFSHGSGIDWEWENRWMIMPGSELLIAKLKYENLIALFTVQQIKA